MRNGPLGAESCERLMLGGRCGVFQELGGHPQGNRRRGRRPEDGNWSCSRASSRRSIEGDGSGRRPTGIGKNADAGEAPDRDEKRRIGKNCRLRKNHRLWKNRRMWKNRRIWRSAGLLRDRGGENSGIGKESQQPRAPKIYPYDNLRLELAEEP
ncbi:hypothetical protein KSP39_PZI011296 [Platanthera zijinensis]|uniref:Uncharacterized protein n=1 Tax=Platanthera zijinensis TaxID=2320716 RepID=A0AAP0BII0_9ASPA